MSCSPFSALYKFVAFMGLALAVTVSPALAQTQTGGFGGQYDLGGSGASSAAVNPNGYQVLGTNIFVDIIGSYLHKSGGKTIRMLAACPFEEPSLGGPTQIAEIYKSAAAAAKAAGDPIGCPFAYNQNKERIYLHFCKSYYETMSYPEKGGDPDIRVQYCHEDAGSRDIKIKKRIQNDLATNMAFGQAMLEENIKAMKAGMQSKEAQKELDKKKAAEEEAKKNCYVDMKKRIGNYWAKRQEVQCYQAVKSIIKNWTADKMFQLANSAEEQIVTAASAVSVQGSSPGAIISTPTPWSGAKIIAIGAKVASVATKIATDADTLITTLNAGCGGIVSGLQDLQSYSAAIRDSLSCQAVASLIERQLTQCIRVDVTAQLNLPRFSLLLQCPVNFNFSANVSPSGFRCFTNASVGSPVTASFGNRSLLGADGGMKALFSGDCFGNGENNDFGNGGFNGSDNDGGSETIRTPGVDCGPLDRRNVLKNEGITGTKYLSAGSGNNGWVVGDSETIKDQAITRCDYFDNGRALRTLYVYGSGTSCNGGASGFLEGGYESNAACYGAGYTPVAAPSIPDSCMYPTACLDSNGKFSEDRQGSGGCPRPAKPVFKPEATYTIGGDFGGGGFGGTADPVAPKSCSDFNDQVVNGYAKCCDPQMQDCTKRDANVPICTCDQGDFNNTIVDAVSGACEKGGKATCCSPRLNGAAWCESNMPAGKASICTEEQADQCVAPRTGATYYGPDNVPTQITAADLISSRPSPYLYLFVRPDTEMQGKQCCMTEWCNICPQHYANAYGLSMKRSEQNMSSNLIGSVGDRAGDSINNAILGRGWPFMSTTDDMGSTTYRIGINPVPYTTYQYNWLSKDEGHESEDDHLEQFPRLMLSPDMEWPLTATINACNKLSSWQTYIESAERFVGSAVMGFVYDESTGKGKIGKQLVWKTIGPVPRMQETPLAYLNRMRSSMSSGDVQAEPIELCSNVTKICIGTLSAPTTYTGTPRPARAEAPAPAPVNQSVQAPVAAPQATGNSAAAPVRTTAPSAPAAPSAGATAVPSATNSGSGGAQAPASLY